MKFVTSVFLLRPTGAQPLFWPTGVASLVLSFWSPQDGSGTLQVYAVDPASQRVVFSATIKEAQQGAFIKAVLEGGYKMVKVGKTKDDETATTITLPGSAKGADSNVVVIGDPGPKDTGPSAVAIPLSVTVAGAVGTANAALAYRKPRGRAASAY